MEPPRGFWFCACVSLRVGRVSSFHSAEGKKRPVIRTFVHSRHTQDLKRRGEERASTFLPSNPAWVIIKAVSLRHLASPYFAAGPLDSSFGLIFFPPSRFGRRKGRDTVPTASYRPPLDAAAAIILKKEKTVENRRRRRRRRLNRIRHCCTARGRRDEWLCV